MRVLISQHGGKVAFLRAEQELGVSVLLPEWSLSSSAYQWLRLERGGQHGQRHHLLVELLGSFASVFVQPCSDRLLVLHCHRCPHIPITSGSFL